MTSYDATLVTCGWAGGGRSWGSSGQAALVRAHTQQGAGRFEGRLQLPADQCAVQERLLVLFTLWLESSLFVGTSFLPLILEIFSRRIAHTQLHQHSAR